MPESANTWPPSRSMMRRASAFASASDAALRLPDAFDVAYTAKPIAATTKMMRTSSAPFMALSVPTGKGLLGSPRSMPRSIEAITPWERLSVLWMLGF